MIKQIAEINSAKEIKYHHKKQAYIFYDYTYHNINISTKNMQLIFCGQLFIKTGHDVSNSRKTNSRVAPNAVPQTSKKFSFANTFGNSRKKLRGSVDKLSIQNVFLLKLLKDFKQFPQKVSI